MDNQVAINNFDANGSYFDNKFSTPVDSQLTHQPQMLQETAISIINVIVFYIISYSILNIF